MQEKIVHVGREMETQRKNQKEMVEIKNTTIKMKNAFDELISRLDTEDERISKLEDISDSVGIH